MSDRNELICKKTQELYDEMSNIICKNHDNLKEEGLSTIEIEEIQASGVIYTIFKASMGSTIFKRGCHDPNLVFDLLKIIEKQFQTAYIDRGSKS